MVQPLGGCRGVRVSNPQVFPTGATRGYAWFNLFEVAATYGFSFCLLTDNRQKTVVFTSLLS